MAVAGEHGFGGQVASGERQIELNGHNSSTQPGRVAIFSESAIGYVHNPEALYARAIAWGFHQQGRHVRMLEERRNAALRRTLESVGSAASRHAFEAFPGILIHSFEPRSGASLMEWVSRELSLVDLAIAIDGAGEELTRWIANLDHRTLTRIFVTYRPNELTGERAGQLELERFDAVFASSEPAAGIKWLAVGRSITEQDLRSVPPHYLPAADEESLEPPDKVARALEIGVRQSIEAGRE